MRRYWISDTLDTISNPSRWASLRSIGMVESERYIDGKTTSETRYFINSLTPDAKFFANAVRKHWSIENQLHSHHVALNALCNEEYVKKGIKAIRFKATLQPDYAQKVLNGIF